MNADAQADGLPTVYESSLAKCYANEIVREVTALGMQVMGGYGYHKDYGMEQPKVVEDASPDLIVRRGAEGMLDPFIQAGRDLIRQGAEVVTTNCGFLALFQRELSAALAVPVANVNRVKC